MRCLWIGICICCLLPCAAAQEPLSLEQCQSRLNAGDEAIAKITTWQKWYDDNKDVPTQLNAQIALLSTERNGLAAENATLRKQVAAQRNMESFLSVFLSVIGLGIGLCIGWAVLRGLYRLWRISVAGRRLVIVLAAAVWVCGAVLYQYGEIELWMPGSTGKAIFGAVAWSLPALLAAWVGLAWMRRQTKDQAVGTVLEHTK